MRISSRHRQSPTIIPHQTRNSMNLISVNIERPTSYYATHIRFATWNAHSMVKKSASICDLVISKHLNILAIKTETWLSGNRPDNSTIAEILNTLMDFGFYHVPRANRTGGGIGVLLRKGFKLSKYECCPFSSLEGMDLSISHGSSSVRLITIYRPPPSKKNRATPATFFKEFSSLIEPVTVTPGYLLLCGDFNFHMESACYSTAAAFRDLLESAGLRQHVTHRSGHTLDLIIDRHENQILSGFSVLSDQPSDHSAVLCSVAFERPKASKSHFKQQRLRDIDLDALKSDILDSPVSCVPNHLSDSNALVGLYNSVLREALDKHAPEMSRSITLRPHAPWYTAGLRVAKRRKRLSERAYRKSGLVVHQQIYQDQCCSYTALLEHNKTQYYKFKIENAEQRDLFRLIDGMFHVKSVPPLPSHDSVEELTEKFSSHFVGKISKLHQRLNQTPTPKWSPAASSTCLCSLAEFNEVSMETVRRTIRDSPSKSCPLGPHTNSDSGRPASTNCSR